MPQIIPCIDLLGGSVVQLVQGEKLAVRVENADEAVAMFAGFPLLHIIDLDAAKGQGNNDELVSYLLSRVRARVGGGVRSVARARSLLDLGAEQVIVGTRAFQAQDIDQPFLTQLTREVGRERVLVALDIKQGRIVVQGWQESLDLDIARTLGRLEPYCSGILCTYVDKEGMLQGTDLEFFLDLARQTPIPLIAAGGITSLEEVSTLIGAGIQVALGMAIYTGRLPIDELRRLTASGTDEAVPEG